MALTCDDKHVIAHVVRCCLTFIFHIYLLCLRTTVLSSSSNSRSYIHCSKLTLLARTSVVQRFSNVEGFLHFTVCCYTTFFLSYGNITSHRCQATGLVRRNVFSYCKVRSLKALGSCYWKCRGCAGSLCYAATCDKTYDSCFRHCAGEECLQTRSNFTTLHYGQRTVTCHANEGLVFDGSRGLSHVFSWLTFLNISRQRHLVSCRHSMTIGFRLSGLLDT